MKFVNGKVIKRITFLLVFIWGLWGWAIIFLSRPIIKNDRQIIPVISELRPRVEAMGGAVYSAPYSYLTFGGWEINSKLVFVGINEDSQQDELIEIAESSTTRENTNILILVFKNGHYSEESHGGFNEGRTTRREVIEPWFRRNSNQ